MRISAIGDRCKVSQTSHGTLEDASKVTSDATTRR
jgi:hypothetical protein